MTQVAASPSSRYSTKSRSSCIHILGQNHQPQQGQAPWPPWQRPQSRQQSQQKRPHPRPQQQPKPRSRPRNGRCFDGCVSCVLRTQTTNPQLPMLLCLCGIGRASSGHELDRTKNNNQTELIFVTPTAMTKTTVTSTVTSTATATATSVTTDNGHGHARGLSHIYGRILHTRAAVPQACLGEPATSSYRHC